MKNSLDDTLNSTQFTIHG